VRRLVPIAAAALLAAASLPATAAAHVEVAPPYVEGGVESTIAFVTPSERPPHATIRLAVTAPPGFAIAATAAPAGWRVTVSGSTATWSGGRVEGRDVVRFPLLVTPDVRAGPYAFSATQAYDDGATVTWQAGLSVLPAAGAAAPAQHPWGAVAAAVAGLAVIASSLLGLRRLRRSSLQQ